MSDQEQHRWSGQERVPEAGPGVDWFTTPMSGCALLLALLWLAVAWGGAFFVLVFSDDQSPQALAFSQQVFWLGLLLGPAPLVALVVVLIRQRRRPPLGVMTGPLPTPLVDSQSSPAQDPQASDKSMRSVLGLSSVVGLVFLALGLFLVLRPRAVPVDVATAIPLSTVVIPDGPDHRTRLRSGDQEQTYDLRGYENPDLPVHLLLPFYLRAGDLISKDVDKALRVGRDGQWSEWQNTGPKL